jgi:hypothetical protein
MVSSSASAAERPSARRRVGVLDHLVALRHRASQLAGRIARMEATMPASYRIDVARRLVLTRAWGVCTAQDLFDHYTALGADPAFDPSFVQLVDLREVERADMEPSVIRRHALEHLFGSGTQRALVTASNVAYELARMYGTFAAYVPQNVRVFRDMRDAQQWLGLEAPVS